VWTYTGVAQDPEEPTPYWQIDFPLLNYRIAPWINYRYEVDGLLYWTTALWSNIKKRGTTPWEDPCSYKSGWTCFNGDGLLVYPGKEIDYIVPAGAYGADSAAEVYGAVPSLRLKALRDAMEDYEYLLMASKTNPVEAELALNEIACAGDPTKNCFTHWNQYPADLLAARERLGSMIEAAVAQAPSRGRNGSHGRTPAPEPEGN
jgi:hypothetical protein